MHTFIKTYIIAALLFVSFASVAQTPNTIIKEGNYTVTGSETLTANQSIILKPNTWIKPGSTFHAIVNPDAYQSISLDINENYVLTRVYQNDVADFNDVTTNSDVIESITYFDGLGRPKQQIGIKASPNKQDIVTHIGYDNYGRPDKSYLPFTASGTVGSYKTVNINTDINSYYQNKYSDDFSGMALGEVNAYSQSIYEPSPLNRVLEQGAPGKAWKANADVDTDHTIKFDWDTNTTNEVVYFKVDFPSANTEVPSLIKDGYYTANQLYVTTTKDENWQPGQTHPDDHTTKEYKDKLGRVILKRTYDQGVEHDTYYVYDDFGNLTYVIPPKVTLSATDGVSPEELSELCYQYRYDYRNRLVRKKIPGKGSESIVYNKLDHPILTQDAVQAPNEEWIFTKYDGFGRVIYSGLYSDDRGRLDMEFDVNTNAQYDQKGPAIIVDNTTLYYTNNAFPNHSQQILTINYYDNYTFDHIVANPGTVYNQTVDTNVKGLATGSKVRVLGTDDWITAVTYYDTKGRPVYVYSTNDYLNTVDIIETKLDFAGKVLETKTTHTKGGNAAIVTIDTFTYDHMGRLLTQSQQINNQAIEQIVSNTYDEMGQLETKEIGGGLQDIDYTYNVRGWLTQINNPANLGNDLFGFKINYNTTDKNLGATSLYNGNISETIWKTANDLVERSYGYQYDALNRLTQADNSFNNYSVSGISYDKNGNIKTLNRRGWQNNGTNANMDNLTYEYSATSNKLLNVTDTGNNNFGFKDGTNANDDFVYDANGNITIDRNKGISSIGYNHLNLPSAVAISNNQGTGNINYIYDATGTKLRKAVTQNGATTTTDYAGNYIYTSNTGPGGCAGCPSNASGPDLQLFNHPEGYIEPQDDGTFTYIYQYKDHLGNIRLSYADKDNDGKVDVLRNNTDADGDGDLAMEIREEKNYYPFGLQHKGYNNTITGREHPYGYNGKEENNELGLEWLDYGARNYNASLGRWMNVDPLADNYRSYSTYNYVTNNPILLLDPDGEQISFSYEYEKDKDGKDIVDKNGNRNLIGVTMTVTGKVMNVSGKSVDIDDAISEISDAITSSFKGSSSNGIKFNTVVNLKEAKSMKDVNDSDHVFALANFPKEKAKRVFGVDKHGFSKGRATGITNRPGGRVAYIDVDYFRGIWDTTIGEVGERTANHEFASHMLNLGHTNNPFDLTYGNGADHSNIRKKQLQTIINRQLNFDNTFINRGTNYDIRFYKLTNKKVLDRGDANRIIE